MKWTLLLSRRRPETFPRGSNNRPPRTGIVVLRSTCTLIACDSYISCICGVAVLLQWIEICGEVLFSQKIYLHVTCYSLKRHLKLLCEESLKHCHITLLPSNHDCSKIRPLCHCLCVFPNECQISSKLSKIFLVLERSSSCFVP